MPGSARRLSKVEFAYVWLLLLASAGVGWWALESTSAPAGVRIAVFVVPFASTLAAYLAARRMQSAAAAVSVGALSTATVSAAFLAKLSDWPSVEIALFSGCWGLAFAGATSLIRNAIAARERVA
jgi:hypothetical protein